MFKWDGDTPSFLSSLNNFAKKKRGIKETLDYIHTYIHTYIYINIYLNKVAFTDFRALFQSNFKRNFYL